jgi:hypothetical protein
MPAGYGQYAPGLGFKIYPQDLAGIIGLPSVGQVIYVDPFAGSDTANDGSSQTNALATVAAAYAKTTSGNHDVVLISPTGGTGRTAETTAITWANKFTHLIGNAAPTMQDARAGMSFSGTAGVAAGSLTVSGTGCVFKQLTFNGTSDVNVPVTITGSYNAFLGVDFKGSLNDTSGDDAASRALYINGGQENYFGGCTFGADTFARSTTNATVEFASAASRNFFDGCDFRAFVDNAGPVHVLLTGTSAIDRDLAFRNCSFYFISANNATPVTACMNLSAQTATGHVRLLDSAVVQGATDWEASASGRIYMQSYTATTTAIGLAINPT